ncbi:hypothetical protein Bca52824_090598 [Brassica carinata]|uniref:Glycine-rich protein n=1 Tax=Brassica carinata TaxID=52824 RepID=A0A8X7NV44_BRACI|nr:hypothetical protein Bca52824_090598 [Brassica carinata]
MSAKPIFLASVLLIIFVSATHSARQKSGNNGLGFAGVPGSGYAGIPGSGNGFPEPESAVDTAEATVVRAAGTGKEVCSFSRSGKGYGGGGGGGGCTMDCKKKCIAYC